MGGVGKTQLALNVIESTHNKWDHIIYVDASSESSIKKTLRDFSVVNDIGKSHEDALSWLKSVPEQWILFLDNADDRSLVTGIRQYIPRSCHGKTIITTRLNDLTVFAKGADSIYHLSSMDQEDGLALLIKSARMEGRALTVDEREATSALLRVCGDSFQFGNVANMCEKGPGLPCTRNRACWRIHAPCT
jgi:hypothetical protein